MYYEFWIFYTYICFYLVGSDQNSVDDGRSEVKKSFA